MVWQKHMSSRKPIQLKRKAVMKAVKKMKSLPRSDVSPGEALDDASGSSSVGIGTRVSLPGNMDDDDGSGSESSFSNGSPSLE